MPVKPWVFPLKNAREKSFESIDGPLELEEVPFLDDADIEDLNLKGTEMHLELPQPKEERKRSITVARFIKFGPSPGCPACREGGDKHITSCRERFQKLFQKVLTSGDLKGKF